MSIRRRLLGDVIINLFQAFDRGGQDHGELSTSSCFLWGEKKTHYQKREQIPFKSKHIFNSEIKTILEILSLLWGYLLSFLFLGKPLFGICCFLMGIAQRGGVCKGWPGGFGTPFPTIARGVRACEDGLEHFFFHVCPFDRGGESKAFWIMPI